MERTNLHQADGYVMEEMIEFGVIEDCVMAKVVLQPTSLCLTGGHQDGRHQPGDPVVAKVPENPPSKNVEGNDVSKQSHKEPHLDLEHALCDRDYSIGQTAINW